MMRAVKQDPIWEQIREETARQAACEPVLASFLHATILNHTKLDRALSYHLADQLGNANASSSETVDGLPGPSREVQVLAPHPITPSGHRVELEVREESEVTAQQKMFVVYIVYIHCTLISSDIC